MVSVIAHYRAMSHQRLVCFQLQPREQEASEQVKHLTRNSSSSRGSSRWVRVARVNPRNCHRAPWVRETVEVAQLRPVVPAVAEVAWLEEVVRTLRPLALAPTVPSSSPSSFPPRTRPHPVGRTRGVTFSEDNEASRIGGQCRDSVERQCLTWFRSFSHEDMDLRAGIASTISIACSTTVRRIRELPHCWTCPSFHRSRTRGVARTINRYRSRTHCSLPEVNRMLVW